MAERGCVPCASDDAGVDVFGELRSVRRRVAAYGSSRRAACTRNTAIVFPCLRSNATLGGPDGSVFSGSLLRASTPGEPDCVVRLGVLLPCCSVAEVMKEPRQRGNGELDPIPWTSSERGIRWPRWRTQAADGPGAASRTSTRRGRSGWCWMKARRSAAAARDLGLTESSLRNWVEQARADRTKGRTGLTTEERAELARLRKDNRELRMERDILKKAAAFFAKHQA